MKEKILEKDAPKHEQSKSLHWRDTQLSLDSEYMWGPARHWRLRKGRAGGNGALISMPILWQSQLEVFATGNSQAALDALDLLRELSPGQGYKV